MRLEEDTRDDGETKGLDTLIMVETTEGMAMVYTYFCQSHDSKVASEWIRTVLDEVAEEIRRDRRMHKTSGSWTASRSSSGRTYSALRSV